MRYGEYLLNPLNLQVKTCSGGRKGHRFRMPYQRGERSTPDIPEAHPTIASGRNDARTVRAERGERDGPRVSVQRRGL